MFLILYADVDSSDVLIIDAVHDRAKALEVLSRHFLYCLSNRNIEPGHNNVPDFPKAHNGMGEWRADDENGRWSAFFSQTAGKFVIEGINIDTDLTGNRPKVFAIIKESEPITAPLPQYENVLNVTLIRQRLCEHECWSDSYQMPISEAEAAELENTSSTFLQKTVKNLMLERLHKAMTSIRGWREVCDASQDFNWGDAVQSGILDDACCAITGHFTARRTICVTVTVNQDELIAPTVVHVTFTGMNGENSVYTDEGILNLQDGNIDLVNILPEDQWRKFTAAKVKLDNGDILWCDRKEEYQRLLTTF